MGTFLLSAAKQALSASRAADKVLALQQVLTRYYPDWVPYDGRAAIHDVQTALAYVVAKKTTKAGRKTAQSAATMAFGVAGAVVGGAAGTVALPGVGSAVGAVTVGQLISVVPTVGTQTFRKFKFLYKTLRGTQGVHRKEAATVLLGACRQIDHRNVDTYAAAAGLLLIIGDAEEFKALTVQPDAAGAIEAIAKRLKSW